MHALILLAALLPLPALAHLPDAAAPVASWWAWNLEPWLLVLLAASALGYAAGLFKSAPLLLTMILFWRHVDELLQSHEAPGWTRYGAPAPHDPV